MTWIDAELVLVSLAAMFSPTTLTFSILVLVLSAIGLSTNVAALRKAGSKPLLLGALLWITVAGDSRGLQALTGAL